MLGSKDIQNQGKYYLVPVIDIHMYNEKIRLLVLLYYYYTLDFVQQTAE